MSVWKHTNANVYCGFEDEEDFCENPAEFENINTGELVCETHLVQDAEIIENDEIE